MKPILLATLALFTSAATAAPPPAWQPLDAPAPGALRNPAATAVQRIRIDPAALRQADELSLFLPGGRSHTLKVVSREARGDGLWLLGSLDGESTAQVSLSLTGGYLGGLISAPEGNYESNRPAPPPTHRSNHRRCLRRGLPAMRQ